LLCLWLIAPAPGLAGSPADGCEVTIRADGVRLAGQLVVPLTAWAPAAEPGAGAGSLWLPALQGPLAELRDARQARRLVTGPGPQALCLSVEREAPYGLLTRVLYTVGQVGFNRLRFPIEDGRKTREISLELPSFESPAEEAAAPGLELTVVVERRGLTLSGVGGRLEPETEADGKIGDPAAPTLALVAGPGCEGGPAPTAACLPLARLGKKLDEIKRAFPEERRVVVAAMPELRFGDLVALLDALRGSAERPLFPDVLLSAGIQ